MRSTAGKVKLDIEKLKRVEDKIMRRVQKMQEKVFGIRKSREILEAALAKATEEKASV